MDQLKTHSWHRLQVQHRIIVSSFVFRVSTKLARDQLTKSDRLRSAESCAIAGADALSVRGVQVRANRGVRSRGQGGQLVSRVSIREYEGIVCGLAGCVVEEGCEEGMGRALFENPPQSRWLPDHAIDVASPSAIMRRSRCALAS